MSRTIAIGDIHGCSKALAALLDAIAPSADDTLVPLGDYVDRGPDSRGVLDLMLRLESQCRLIPLIGNHEQMFLSVLAGDMDPRIWQRCGGAETLASYDGDAARAHGAHLDFLHRCQRYYQTDTHVFMHANYIAHLELDDQPETMLLWTHISSIVPPPHRCGKIAVVGHTPQMDGEILDLGHLVCIDTCCVSGGWLTALDVTTGQVWQARRTGELREAC